MAFEFSSPKYLRDFVLNKVSEGTERIEDIARAFTVSTKGLPPPLFSKSLPEYAKSAKDHQKKVRICCRELAANKDLQSLDNWGVRLPVSGSNDAIMPNIERGLANVSP